MEEVVGSIPTRSTNTAQFYACSGLLMAEFRSDMEFGGDKRVLEMIGSRVLGETPFFGVIL